MNNMQAVKMLLCLLCISLFFNIIVFRFYITSNQSSCEDKSEIVADFVNNSNNVSFVSNQTLISPPYALLRSNETIIPDSVVNTTISYVFNSTTPKPKRTGWGNVRSDNIFQQRKDRKRRSYSDQELLELPSFSTTKVMKYSEIFISLNERLISSNSSYDFIILMPSLARISPQTGNHADYLITVLDEYEKQLTSIPKGKSVLFLIHAFMNEKSHLVFKKAAKKFKHVKDFVFFVPPFRFRDPYADIPDVDYSSPRNSYPGKMARQQSCDVLSMTQFVINNFKFKYLLYTEDDFLPCDNMLLQSFNYMEKIEMYHEKKLFQFEKGFCSMRLTVGLGGFIITKHYAKMFIEYAKNNIDFEPIDILIHFTSFRRGDGYPNCLDDGLTHYTSKQSILKHIGHESNWKERNDKKVFGGRDVKCGENLGQHDWNLGNKFGAVETSRNCKGDNGEIKPCVPENQ